MAPEILTLLITAMLGVAFLVYLWNLKIRPRLGTKPDIDVQVIRLDPPDGSVVLAGEPITVYMKYRYSNPRSELPIWVKIFDDEVESTYQGSCDYMSPGSGEVNRYAHINHAGEVREMVIIVKNADFEEIYRKPIAVNYRVAANAKLEALKQDGFGSSITKVQLSVPAGSVLKVGTTVDVTVEYDINSEHGLGIWSIPLTDCAMSYSGSGDEYTGRGSVDTWFVVGEACQLHSIRVNMANQGKVTVFEQEVVVDLTYVA